MHKQKLLLLRSYAIGYNGVYFQDLLPPEQFVHLSLFKKLFLSILLVCLAMLVVMTVLINSSFREGLQSYINEREVAEVEIIASKLSNYYSPNEGWEPLLSNPAPWLELLQHSQAKSAENEMFDRPPQMTYLACHRERHLAGILQGKKLSTFGLPLPPQVRNQGHRQPLLFL